MDSASSCSSCAHYKKCVVRLNEEQRKKLNELEEDKKTLQKKIDFITDLNLQYKEFFFKSSKCIQIEKLKEEASKKHDECVKLAQVLLETTKDYTQIKQKKDEYEVLLKNLEKQIEEKEAMLLNLKFIIGQLEHENNKYKSDVVKLEKEVNKLSNKLSARCSTSKTKKSSRASRFAKQLLELGKLGDKDRKWLKSVTEEEEDSDEDNYSKENGTDGSQIPRNSNGIAASEAQNQVVQSKCILSPDEGLGWSPAADLAINQLINQTEDDSNCAVYNESEETVQPQDICLDLKFDEFVKPSRPHQNTMGNQSGKNTDVMEPVSGDDSVDYYFTAINYNHMNAMKKFSQNIVPGNKICNETEGKKKTVSNSNIENGKMINDNRHESTVKECGDRILSSNLECTGEMSEEEPTATIRGIDGKYEMINTINSMNTQKESDKNIALSNAADMRKIGEEQPVETSNINVEVDNGSSENNINIVEDDSFGSAIVRSENEITTVDGQEGNIECLEYDDDLYSIESGVEEVVSSSCEMILDRTLCPEECSKVTSGNTTGDEDEFEELSQRQNECRRADIEPVDKSAWHQKNEEKKHQLKTKCQQKQKTTKKKVYTRKQDTSYQNNLIHHDQYNNNSNNNNNNNGMVNITMTNVMDWLADQLKARLGQSNDFSNEKSGSEVRKQLGEKCTNKKSCKKKDTFKPKKSLLSTETPDKSSCTVDYTVDISPLPMDAHSECHLLRIGQKSKQIIKSSKRKLRVQEVKPFVKKRKLLLGRRKFKWSITESSVPETRDFQGEGNDILKSVDEVENNQRQPSDQFQVSVSSQLPTLSIQALSSVQCEVVGQVQPSIHVQSSVWHKPSDQSQSLIPCKDMRDKSLSPATSEVMSQKQSCVIMSESTVQLQPPASCQQPSELLNKSQSLSTLCVASSQLHCSAQNTSEPSSTLSQLATPSEISSQAQACDTAHSLCEQLLNQQLPLTMPTDEPLVQQQSSSQQSEDISQSDDSKHFGTNETRVLDHSLAQDMEMHAALSEQVLINADKSEICDIGSEIEVPANTANSSDSTLKDLYDFVFDEELIGDFSQPVLNSECMGDSTKKHFHSQEDSSSVSSSFMSRSEDGRKMGEEQNSMDRVCHEYDDIQVISSDKQLISSGKQHYTAGCESDQVEQFDTVIHLPTVSKASNTNLVNATSKLPDFAENFDINMSVMFQDCSVPSSFDNLIVDEENVTPGNRISDTTAVMCEENTDVGLTVEIRTEEDDDGLTVTPIGQEDGGIGDQPEISDLQQMITTATRKTKETTDISLSPLVEKSIRTTSLAKQISQDKYSAVSETMCTKMCKKKTVKPKCIDSGREKRIVTRSLTKSMAHSRHLSNDNLVNSLLNNSGNKRQRKKRTNSNVCEAALQRVNQEVFRVVSKAKLNRRTNRALVDSHILEIEKKTEALVAMPLQFDSSTSSVAESESVPVVVSGSNTKTITSPPLKNMTQNYMLQTDEKNTKEIQVQPVSMPVLDNYETCNRLTQEVCETSISPVEEHETGTDVKKLQTVKSSVMHDLNAITNSLENTSSGCTVNAADVRLNEDDVADDESQSSLDMPSDGYTSDEMTVDVESDVLSTAYVWPDQKTVYGEQKKLSSVMKQEALTEACSEKCASSVNKEQCMCDTKISSVLETVQTQDNRQKQESSSAVNVIPNGKSVIIKCSGVQNADEFCKSVQNNSTSLTHQNVSQNQNTLNLALKISDTVENKSGKNVNFPQVSEEVTSSSDSEPKKKLFCSYGTRTCHDVNKVSPHLEKHSLSTSKQCVHVENELFEERDDHDHVVLEPNVVDSTDETRPFYGANMDELLHVDLATSSSSDSESVPEETVGKHINSNVKKVSGDITKNLYKGNQVNKTNRQKQIEKNHASNLVNETELGDSEKMECKDILDSDSCSGSTTNVPEVAGGQSIVTTEVSKDDAASSSGKKRIAVHPMKGDTSKSYSPDFINSTPKAVCLFKMKNTSSNKSDTNMMTIKQSRSLVDSNTSNRNRSSHTVCPTGINLKNKSISLESPEKSRETKTIEHNTLLGSCEDELENLFNEVKCPSLITPFSSDIEKNSMNCMTGLDTKEVFKRPELIKQHVRIRTPKIYRSENDSESDVLVTEDFNLQMCKNGNQEVCVNVLSDNATVCTVQNGTHQTYEMCKENQFNLDIVTTAVKNETSRVYNKESSKLDVMIQEERAEVVNITKNKSVTSSSSELVQRKHILPQVIVRPGIGIAKNIKTNNKKIKYDMRTEDKKSIKMARMSVVSEELDKQMNLLTEKSKGDSSVCEKDADKMHVDDQPDSVVWQCTPSAIETGSLSHDIKRTTVTSDTVGGLSALTHVSSTGNSETFGADSSTCPNIIKRFSFYNSDGFVENEDVKLSCNADNFNELLIDDTQHLKCKEEGDSGDDVDIEELSKYLVPCYSNVLAKAYEFHRHNICKPRETIRQEAEKRMSDSKIVKERAALVRIELMKLISCTSRDEQEKLLEALHSIRAYSKQEIADGIVLVLCDDPVEKLTPCDEHKHPLKRLKLPPPTVSRTKQLLLSLINMLLRSAVFENDFYLCVGLKIKKELFCSKRKKSILSSVSLVQFYTLMCRMNADIWSVKALMYNLLCALKNRCYTLIFEVLLMWPRILIPASDVSHIPNQLIHMTMMHCIMNGGIPRDTPLMRVVPLKDYLKTQYGYKIGEHSAEQMLQILIDRLDESDCKYALTLLCKQSKASWNQTKVIPALMKAVEMSWYTKEEAARSAIWLLGIVCRILPPSAQNEIDKTFEFLKSYLFHKKGCPRLEEEIVVALAHMHHLNKKYCVETLTQWRPKHGSISVRVLKWLKVLIASHHPRVWSSYFSKVEEIDKELKENKGMAVDCVIQKYGCAVNEMLYEI